MALTGHTSRHLRFAVAVCLLVLVGSLHPAFALTIHTHKAPRSDQRAIEHLEQQIRTSLLAGDAATLDRLLADDFLGISSNGTLSNKQQYLRRLSKREHTFTRIDVLDTKFRFQPSSAVVTSLSSVAGVLDGLPTQGTFRYTRVYRRQTNGSWKVINFEATRVSGPSGADLRNGIPMPR